VFDANPAAQLLKANLPKSFCQQVSHLICRRHIVELDPPFLDTLPDEMEANVNVLASIMKYWIHAQCYGRMLVDQ
jgi:hypothetical protein